MASQDFDTGLLKQEVVELTEMLRSEEVLEDLRALLHGSGINPQKVLLAGFLENADGFEGGVLITEEREIFNFERTVTQSGFSVFQSVDDATVLFDTYPALPVALDMKVP
jgi:arginine decarboxylase-like protein